MVYRIEWRPRARKAFLALDKPVRLRIAADVDKLADDPRPAGVKALTGMPGVFRIRVAFVVSAAGLGGRAGALAWTFRREGEQVPG